MRLSRSDPSALVASIAAHCVLVGLGAWFWARSAEPPAAPPPFEVAIEEHEPDPGGVFEGNSGSERLRVPVQRPEPQLAGGGEHAPRPDIGRPGKGGTLGSDRAANLSSSIDPLTLERDAPNHWRRSEVQRLAVARVRRSWDDRRATPQPMELDFVASGKGKLNARRPLAASNPGPGSNVSSTPEAEGFARGTDPGDNALAAIGDRRLGGHKVPAAGVPLATSGEVRRSASIITARPWVPQERAAVPAAQRDRPSDTVDSQQRVASRVAALMQASALGGNGEQGVGGEPSPMPPAAGADHGSGSRSSPAGSGAGPYRELGSDPGLEGFYRQILARLDSALRGTFPHWAIVEGRGGMVVFDLVLHDDGRVSRVAVVRPSGIAEYDRNVLVAVRGIPSFGRVPSAFGGRAVLRISWDSLNPVVGRDGRGPGQRPH